MFHDGYRICVDVPLAHSISYKIRSLIGIGISKRSGLLITTSD